MGYTWGYTLAKSLTIEAVRRYPRPDDRRYVKDANTRGLYLILEPSGLKRWALRYKVGTENKGRQYWYPLAPFGEDLEGHLDLNQARAAVQAWRGRIAAGELPHVVRAWQADAQEREQKLRDGAPTVADLGTLFRERYLESNTRRPDARMVAFHKWVVPELGGTKLVDVKRRDLNCVLEAVEDAGKLVTANSLARLLGQMFRWAVDRDYIPDSPAERLSAGKSHTPRSRVLTDEEIRAVSLVLDRDDLKMSTAIRIGLKLLLLTGARSGELAAAKWADVQVTGDMAQWTIPAQVTKGGRTHLVPLAPGATRLFTSLHALTGDTPYCLPAAERVRRASRAGSRRRMPTGHLDSHAIATALRRTILQLKKRKELTFKPFGAHDLRRTLRTGLSRIGIAADLAERVIGHAVRNPLVSTYDVYDRLKERRAALVKWDAEVRRILTSKPEDKVKELSTQRAARPN